MFELKERDGLARICTLSTRHGKVTTPALLPVVNPNQLTISPHDMASRFGVEMLITNSYIIWNDRELREMAEQQGVHGLLGFEGSVMTDSGTFQDHVYGDVRVDPKEIVEFQAAIGADIGTILDVFSEPEFDRNQAEEAAKETTRRAGEATGLKGDMMLAGPVQGSVYPDIRERCARELSALDLDVHPIGGVVPLLEGYRYDVLADIIIASKKGLDPSRPVHLFGAGHPLVFPLAVLLGCDLFDSASYAKYAKTDRMMFADGTRFLGDMRELDCPCPACASTSIEELRAIAKPERTKLLAEHNLHVSIAEIKKVRNAIHEGSIWELAEMRARSHPSLLAALKALKPHVEYLERFEPASRHGAFFYCGPESHDRPAVRRYRERYFERYRRPDAKVLVGFEEASKPYSRTYWREIKDISSRTDAAFVVFSFFGPAPIELDEYYPIAQSVIPKELDAEVKKEIQQMMERHAHGHGFSLAVVWEGEQTLKFLEDMVPGGGRFGLDMMRCRAVLDMQFGKGAGDILSGRKIDLVKSKKTGKIRNVHIDGVHAFSMRAHDGRFTPKLEGARLLMEVLPPPKMRVTIEDEPAEFAVKGNNVFAKFVLDCDPDIRPRDDVFVVNTKGDLAAVGRALMVREEMLAFKRGLAVRVKDAPS